MENRFTAQTIVTLSARLETRVKRNGKWCREVVYLVSSFTLEQLQAQGMLRIKRDYWVVESRLHHCLDMTLREDQSRVRTPGAARVLGTIRSGAVSASMGLIVLGSMEVPFPKFQSRG